MSSTRIGTRRQQLINYGKNLIYSIAPSINALYDSGVVATGARDYASQKYKSKFAQILFIVPISIFSFLQSIGLNFKSTVENIKETELIVRARRIPRDWIPLTNNQEKLAMGIGAVITLGSAFGDYCGGDYFVRQLPEDFEIQNDINENSWNGLSVFTGVVACITTILTEGVASYQNVRGIIARDKTPYTQTWLAFTAGYFLVTLAALEASGETYAGVKQTIPGSTADVLKWVLLFPSLTKIASDFFFAGKITLSAIDDFALRTDEVLHHLFENSTGFGYLLNKFWQARAEFCALAICSVGAAIWVEYPQRALTDDLLVDSETSPPFPVPYEIRELLGWCATLRDGILQIATLFPIFLYLMHKLFCLPTQSDEFGQQPIHPIGLEQLTYDSTPAELKSEDSAADIEAAAELVVYAPERTTASLMQGTLTFYQAKLVHRQVGITTPLEQLHMHLLPRFNLPQFSR